MDYVEYKKIESRPLKVHTSEEERPREKALRYGVESLTLPELFAIILGSGSIGEDVVKLATRIMADNDNKLYQIARQGLAGLRRYRGVGEVKGLLILATLEIARRYQLEEFKQGTQVTSSKDAYKCLSARMNLDHEEFWILMLNRQKVVMAAERVSSGGTAMTVVDVKMVLKPALERLADGIIVAHNHPSDNPNPSPQDDRLTEKLAEACSVLDLQMLDHIIVCRGGLYYSYNDNNRLSTSVTPAAAASSFSSQRTPRR